MLNNLEEKLEYVVKDDENTDDINLDDDIDGEYVAMNIDKVLRVNEDSGKKEKEAYLTQKSKSDEYYEPFTIYPMNEKRKNDTATNLFQMKKVLEDPITYRERKIDILGFPDLFSCGKNGMHDEERRVKLTDV